jgi:hypothetical protein
MSFGPFCSITWRYPSCDQPTHHYQLGNISSGISAMTTFDMFTWPKAIAAIPGPQGRRGHANLAG